MDMRLIKLGRAGEPALGDGGNVDVRSKDSINYYMRCFEEF